MCLKTAAVCVLRYISTTADAFGTHGAGTGGGGLCHGRARVPGVTGSGKVAQVHAAFTVGRGSYA